HAAPGRGDRRARRPAGLRHGDLRALSVATRRACQGLARIRLESRYAEGVDVRVGENTGRVPETWLARVLQAIARQSEGVGFARDRLRRIRRWPRAFCNDRERAANPAGDTRDQADVSRGRVAVMRRGDWRQTRDERLGHA